MSFHRLSLALVVASSVVGNALTAHAENWGHWRGPLGNSVATSGNPPVEWSETKNVKWKVPVPGTGSGSPVIWGDRVFVVTAVPTGNASIATPSQRIIAQQRPQGRRTGRRRPGGSRALVELRFMLLCFNRNDGELLWQKEAIRATPHEGTHSTNGFASASPCTDGEHVYAHFGSRGLYCYTMDGELKWKRDFGKMSTRNTFGEGSSPTIHGDKILVPWDHEGPSFLYALNKTNGDILWKTPRDEPSCWATPLVVGNGDKKQVVMNGQTCARGYDLESGKELWRCGGQTQRPCASAVAEGDLVFVGSGFQGSYLGAFRLTGTGDIEGTKSVEWSIGKDTPDIASPLLSNGRLYFHKGKSGVLTCLDAKTGKPHYTASRIPAVQSTYASPVAVGGHVYLTGRGGSTTVIRDADRLEVVATNSLDEGIDATPAPAGDELFIRSARHLYCIANQ